MAQITAQGYIVHDNNDTIHGYGPTADAAYADMRATMAAAQIQLISDDEDSYDIQESWTRESAMKTIPATAALLDLVETHGGDCGWDRVGMIACTNEEAEG